MNKYSLGCCAAVVMFASGCAHYKIQPIAPAELGGWASNQPPKRHGYIFYQPELYFAATMVTEEAKENSAKWTVTVAPIYLPNYQKPYRLTTHNVLAKADFGFEFENGWKLTKLSDKSDNSTLANTLAGDLKTILTAGGMAAFTKAGSQPGTRVFLFRPEFDEKTGYFKKFVSAGELGLQP